MERLVDINCNLFARGNDFIDFIESAQAVALASELPAIRADLPDRHAATSLLTPPRQWPPRWPRRPRPSDNR